VALLGIDAQKQVNRVTEVLFGVKTLWGSRHIVLDGGSNPADGEGEEEMMHLMQPLPTCFGLLIVFTRSVEVGSSLLII